MANSILFAVIDSSSIPLNTLFAYIMFSIWRTHYVNSFAVSGVVHVVTCNNKIQQRNECKYVFFPFFSLEMEYAESMHGQIQWHIERASERVNWQPNERASQPCTQNDRYISEAIISVIYMYEYRKMQQCLLYARIGDYIIFIENTFICSINSWRLRSIYISPEHSITNIVWYCWCAHRSTISFLPYLRIQILTRI